MKFSSREILSDIKEAIQKIVLALEPYGLIDIEKINQNQQLQECMVAGRHVCMQCKRPFEHGESLYIGTDRQNNQIVTGTLPCCKEALAEIIGYACCFHGDKPPNDQFIRQCYQQHPRQ